MIAAVTHLEHLGGWRFRVGFSNGASGVWDYSAAKDRTGPIAAPLHDEAYIARAFLDAGAPTWPNGWDVSPLALYEDLRAAGALAPAPHPGGPAETGV